MAPYRVSTMNLKTHSCINLFLQDPKKSPVWEITGNEFTKSDIHTAAGISVRFPRITRMRDDKTWQTATSMKELQDLYKASKEKSDFDIDYSTKSSTTEDHDDIKKEVKEEEKMSVDDDDDEDYNAETDIDDDEEDKESKVILTTAQRYTEYGL